MDIKVENYTKMFGAQKAVDNISFKVNTGEVLGFLGPNGAGKTTTMKAITTYLAPTAGNIWVGEYAVIENPEEVTRHIGYLPENNPLYPEMGVIDYLYFMAGIHEIPKGQQRQRVLEMVKVCGLEKEKHKKIQELSKGYQQRVGLAQALIHDPDVLILDEPTSGLDPNQIIEIRELIKRIGKEKTVILSSHILAEVEATCDRILIINNGKIVADGTAETLRKQAQGKEILKVKIEDGKSDDVFRILQHIDTVESVDFIRSEDNVFELQSKPDMSSRRAVYEACVKNNWYLTEMTPIETKLEDVFRNLTMN
jgi:ABC-2 type transport system ATP-binding protein